MNYPIIHVHVTKEFKVMFISDAAKTKDMPLAAKLNRIGSIKEEKMIFFSHLILWLAPPLGWTWYIQLVLG